MKASLCIVVLVATAVFAAEDKKPEKRGVLGLGYGGYSAPVVGHGGLYGGHGLGLYNHGLYGGGLYGGGLYGGGLYGGGLGGLGGHGLVGHGALAAPLLGHGYYGGAAAPLHGYGSPWLGLGHGYLH